MSGSRRDRGAMSACFLSFLPLISLLMLIVFVTATPKVQGKGFHVIVEASWNETSFYQEGCEWAARSFGNEAFYRCLDALWPSPPPQNPHDSRVDSERTHEATSARFRTQQLQYTTLLEVLFGLPETQGADRVLFEAEMAARVYSPAVEAHYDLAEKALRETTAAPSLPGKDDHNQGEHVAAVALACGEPFAVVYTRSEPGAPLQALHIKTPSALKSAVRVPSEPQSGAFISTDEVTIANFDHRYTTPSMSFAPEVPAVVILYGLPGSAVSHALHRAAVEVSTPSDIANAAAEAPAYFWRHLPVSVSRLCTAAGVPEQPVGEATSTWDSPLVVQGYGVTVDIKNMEYKVLDEKTAAQQLATEQSSSATAASSPHDGTDAAAKVGASRVPEMQIDRVVGGFHISRLKERYPDLTISLDEFATLLDEEDGSGDMKVNFDVWELQSIGLAATQYIGEVKNSKRRLHVLKEVVTRFPTYATAFSSIAAQPARLEPLQKALSILHQRIAPGQSAFFVEGWHVEDMSLFGVLHAFHEEERVDRRIKAVLTTLTVSADGAGAATDNAECEVRSVSLEPAVLQKVVGDVKRATRRTIRSLEDSASTGTAYAIPEEYITWINNVETAPQLQWLPAKLSALFARGPDVTPFPRRNVLNYVFLLNPVSKSSLEMLSLMLHLYQQTPVARYGVALADPNWSPVYEARVQSAAGGFQGESAVSKAALHVFALVHHLSARDRSEGVLMFLMELLQAAAQVSSDTVPDAVIFGVCEKNARALLGSSVAELTSTPEILNHYHETQAALHRFRAFQYPSAFLNGVLLDRDMTLMSEVLQGEMKLLRQWVSSGALRDEMPSMYDAILKLRGAADHLQPALLRPPLTMRWSDHPVTVAYVESLPYVFSAAYAEDVPALTQLVTLPCELTAKILQQLLTVMAALEECGAAVEGHAPFDEVCRSLRLSLVSCPSFTSPIHRHIKTLQQKLDRSSVPKATRYTALQRYVSHLVRALAGQNSDRTAILDTETVTAALAAAPLPADLQALVDIPRTTDSKASPHFSEGQMQFWVDFVDVYSGSADTVALITNGRIVAMDDSFSTADVLAAAQLVAPITKVVQEVIMNLDFAAMSSAEGGGYPAEELDSNFYAGKTACLSSVFGDELSRRAVKQNPLESTEMLEDSALVSEEDREQLGSVLFTVSNTRAEKGATEGDAKGTDQEGAGSALVEQLPRHVTVLVDPSSRDAQVIVSLAHYLVQSPLPVRLTVVLNPSLDVKFPIRDFYEYVARPALSFEEASGRVVAPAAVLTQMPSSALLTLGVDEPASWTVFSQDAEVDLDNVMLSTLPNGILFVTAVYRMHSILVTGDATSKHTGAALNGLPLSLVSPSHTGGTAKAASAARRTDTQVMANQGGYYQLQANPGLWYLSVKEGAVAAAYCIEAIGSRTVHECAEATQGQSPTNWTDGQRIPLVIDSFRGRYLSLRVGNTPTSAVATDLHTILQKMASNEQPARTPSWPARGAPPAPPEKPTLNIFSVASGHLYERFLRMMMYSVHQTSSDKHGANTTRIKFWVIENFLSPQFKRYIPLLAEQIGFEVGFVTYRWPWWLPRQTEKQRKIWAYKILFLDVLFPLDVDRVIFVDADQTAQSDLHELYNMDIGQKPIAMTPFCQKFKNNATVPFRFWEKGFWVQHLRGKPYHISAIFLVDLRRFRAMLAGDQYRLVYTNLVQDPNSLANLDQDLPNYLQDTIPIFSLKEEWLWCETWCSEESKSRAKTIDLCNNPLTKMPKLDNAKKVIPGWEERDNQLQNMSDSFLA
ncbi:hypothetical protein JKF63_00463 [Porcisia hertigi]|uniref:UDP-glucose:glycoprotein glucosyltransferase n=1 Tax=Porcisia hertigi TaxID=2761500 RepID=A0A836L6W5_9TRYP|nr:hypothetical protein JKF63_00463 [Porcisia hertigi]